MEPTTRLIDLTVGDLLAVMGEMERRMLARIERASTIPPRVEGIEGIARLYGCSRATAQRIKASGKIDAAITQVGRKIVVDTRRALQLYDTNINNH